MTYRVLSDPHLVEEATRRAKEADRSLRVIREDPYRDMTIVEDRNSGDRRRVANKAKTALDVNVAFELADPEVLEWETSSD